MTTTDTIIRNFEEIRRKSIKLWTGLTPDFYTWRPDAKAFSFLEMVRHILETEYVYHIIVKNRGGHGDSSSPWTNRPYTTIQDDLAFAEPFRKEFMKTISEFSDKDLAAIQIVRSERVTRTLGEFLFRCNYHEATHAGQFLSYLRTIGLERPNIWE
jgi:uncharacterized damage-inducible protein DinB